MNKFALFLILIASIASSSWTQPMTGMEGMDMSQTSEASVHMANAKNDSSLADDTASEDSTEDSTTTESSTDSSSDNMAGMDMSDPNMQMASMQGMTGMHMSNALVEPNGSGTAWLPKSSPVHDHAFHFSEGAWNIMMHGQAILRYTMQNANNPGQWPRADTNTTGASFYPSGERGGNRIDGPNWFMAEAERTVLSEDHLVLRTMMSLDPLTETKRGYPLLFQDGEGLVDRQHPHDLFMEIAALYSHRFNEDNSAFVYFGLPGEPALGPVAFMHRVSYEYDPDAPLSHHMQDATHITYGVATLGWIYRDFKLDASTFRGREPDNRRWDVEAPRFDSYSTRLTYNLNSNLSTEASGGFLKDVEPDEPNTNIFKTIASLDYNLPFGHGGNWASSLIYGANHFEAGARKGTSTQSYTFETTWDPGPAALWLHCENIERSGEELDLASLQNEFFWVHTLSLGVSKPLFHAMGMELILSGKTTANFIPQPLETSYGDFPMAFEVFLTLRASKMKM